MRYNGENWFSEGFGMFKILVVEDDLEKRLEYAMAAYMIWRANKNLKDIER